MNSNAEQDLIIPDVQADFNPTRNMETTALNFHPEQDN